LDQKKKKVFPSIRLIETSIGLGFFMLSIVLYRFPATYLWAHAAAIAATIVCGREMVIGAVTGVLSGKLNVAELVTLAIIASLTIGEYLVAAEVALIMTVGGYLEERVIDKSKKSIHNLAALVPSQARIRRDQKDILVPLTEVKPGDTALVKPGEEIPVDGKILTGHSLINEASITGENRPVAKASGATVYAGSINIDGALAIETAYPGSQSALAKMVELTEKALADKPPSVRLADRFATWFTPFVLTLATGVYMLSGDLIRAITVLVVMCPCTLVLSIPTALAASLGKLVRNGILPKGGIYLEKAAEVDLLVLDKTGTLTLGQPVLAGVFPLNRRTEEELLVMAAVAEKFSSHAVAKEVVAEAEKRGLHVPDPDQFKTKTGQGVVASLNGKEIRIGSREYFSKSNIKNMEAAEALADDEEKLGRTTFLVASDGEVAGLFSMEDRLREETRTGIERLKKLIPRLIMLTGDNVDSACRVANNTGIPEFKAHLLPEDKVEALRIYNNQGHTVAAVGDGMNDAPLLASADVGIVMGDTATPITMEAGSIVLTGSDFLKLPLFFQVARNTRSIIKQNVIIFAIIYNLVSFLLAAFGYLSPLGGAIVHNVGSTMVVLNSIRLLK